MYNTYRTLRPWQGFIGSQDQGSLMEGLPQTQMLHHHTSTLVQHGCTPALTIARRAYTTCKHRNRTKCHWAQNRVVAFPLLGLFLTHESELLVMASSGLQISPSTSRNLSVPYPHK